MFQYSPRRTSGTLPLSRERGEIPSDARDGVSQDKNIKLISTLFHSHYLNLLTYEEVN